MKAFSGKLLAKLHWIIMAYAAWSIYTLWDQHQTTAQAIAVQVPEIESEITKSKKRLEDINDYRRDIESSRKNVEEVFKNIEKVQRQLPAEVNDIAILDFLAREGRSVNIQDLEPTPLPEASHGFYIAKPYEIRGEGTFLQFLVFMERLAAAERLFNIPSFKLTSADSTQKGRFKVITLKAVVETFKYNAGHQESSGLDEIDAQFKEGGEASAAPQRRRRPRAERAGGGGGDD